MFPGKFQVFQGWKIKKSCILGVVKVNPIKYIFIILSGQLHAVGYPGHTRTHTQNVIMYEKKHLGHSKTSSGGCPIAGFLIFHSFIFIHSNSKQNSWAEKTSRDSTGTKSWS